MWKFHDFPITQILCEINFCDSRRAKSAVSTHLGALIFGFHEYLQSYMGRVMDAEGGG